MEFLSPNKELKVVDVKLCIICQVDSGQYDYTKYVANPTIKSIQKIIDTAKVRCGYGEKEFSDLINCTHGYSSEKLLSMNVSYHKQCYQDLTHKRKIERARARFTKGAFAGDVGAIRKKKRGRPSASTASGSEPSTHMRIYPLIMKSVCCAKSLEQTVFMRLQQRIWEHSLW